MTPEQILERAEVVRLEPYDVLLIGNVGSLTEEMQDKVRRVVTDVLPDHKVVIFQQAIAVDAIDVEMLDELRARK